MNDIREYAKEIHKPVKHKFERRHISTFYPNDIWSIDLVDVSNIKEDNDNVTFLLNIIDIYSRYAYSFPLKSKKASEILNVFKKLKVLPTNIWSDEGNEFYNKDFKKFCKENNINLYHTYSGLKSVFVERFNRTLKENLYKYFTEHNTDEYLKILPNLIDEYNNTVHSKTKKTPIDIYFNNEKPYFKKDIKNNKYESKFSIGDYVRISKYKKTFEKGYTPRFSKEVFKIITIDTNSIPYVYKIEDLLGEEIKGYFYEEELQKTNLKDFAIVEKIIKERKIKGKKMYFVKYDGYPEKFNEWISQKRLEDIT
jgi:hypothetical protein